MRALFFVVLLVALAIVVGRDVQRQLSEPLDIPGGYLVDVPKGASLGGLLRDWERQGLLRSARQRLYLAAYARISGQAGSIKAGEYEFGPGMRPIDLTALLVSGRAVLHELRLIEGWRFEEALRAVRQHAAIAPTLPQADAAALMAALGRPELHAEGRFYPDTYRFPRGTTDLAFLRRAFETMESALAEEWAARAENLPYTAPDEALIMASIVERETSVVDERAAIAGVFVRRLEKGMRLQTDPTVIYGLGAAFDGNLRKADLLTDTPYNTYTRRGLPPTPICLPGRAAIRAALHPAPGKTLYFVARGDGSHQFSETIAEHDAAVRKYQMRRRPPTKALGGRR
jgi:UPF0755 protein